MKLFVVNVLIVTVAVLFVDGNPVKYYASKYEHLDLKEILSNRRMVKYYANCLLSKGPCTPQGQELKKILPEALETNCSRCSEKQKIVTYQSIKRLQKEYPLIWSSLEAKWDPNHIFLKRFEESCKHKSPPNTLENEIIITNRFGDSDDDVKSPSPTIKVELKKAKPTISVPLGTTKPPTAKSSRRPSINSISSENKPVNTPPSTEAPVNVTNQVGVLTQEIAIGKIRQLPVSTDIVSTPATLRTTISSALTTLTQTSFSGVTFDIPKSSMKHPETLKLLQPNSTPKSIPKTTAPSTTKNTTLVNSDQYPKLIPKITAHRTNKKTTSVRSDPIARLVFSFLDANKPSTIRPKTTSTTPSQSENLQIRLPKISGLVRRVGNRHRTKLETNTTVKISLRKPLLQVKLPGLPGNNQVEAFNPVGKIVRGIANAGDRLITTGTNIADSVLTSVKDLFTPPSRRKRRN